MIYQFSLTSYTLGMHYKSLTLVNYFWKDDLNPLIYTLGRVIKVAKPNHWGV